MTPDSGHPAYAPETKDYMEAKAGKGDMTVQECLCQPDFDPWGLTPDEQFDWCIRAADGGSSYAREMVQYRLYGGMGGYHDAPSDAARTKAIAWLEADAAKGNQQTQYVLGEIYREGTVVPQDLKKAALLYLEAAKSTKGGDADDTEAPRSRLADIVASAKDLDVLAPVLEAAEAGSPIAQFALAYGNRRDHPAEAAKWFQRMAAAGDGDAAYSLAGLYARDGDTANFAEAAKWYRTLLKDRQRGGAARCQLGLLYETGGQGLAADHAQALGFWGLKEAEMKDLEAQASAGDAKAALKLGRLYLPDADEDPGCALEMERAHPGSGKKWLTLAADHGSAEALYQMGYAATSHLRAADGYRPAETPDEKEGMDQLFRAAELGSKDARCDLLELRNPADKHFNVCPFTEAPKPYPFDAAQMRKLRNYDVAQCDSYVCD